MHFHLAHTKLRTALRITVFLSQVIGRGFPQFLQQIFWIKTQKATKIRTTLSYVYVCMCVCVCVYVCTIILMWVCMYVCMYIYVSRYLVMFVCM